MVLVEERTPSVRQDASAADPSGETSRPGPFGRLRQRVRARPGGALAWRIGITVLGVAIIVVGIVLLPLPGPGWLIIFAGLGLLATEYDRAARLLAFAKLQVTRWTNWIAQRPRWLQVVISAVILAAVLAIVYGAWLVSRSLF